MKQLFKYRHGFGIAPYDIIKDNNDGTLDLRDTTCMGHKSCEIRVKKDGDKYVYLHPLNDSAREYYYFHTREPFYESKKSALFFYLEYKINENQKRVAERNKEMEEERQKIQKMESTIKNYEQRSQQYMEILSLDLSYEESVEMLKQKNL